MKYGDLVNLKNYAGDAEPVLVLTFSSDFLVERKALKPSDGPTLTPFLANLELASDREKYLSLLSYRRAAATTFWPRLDRANTHRTRGDSAKFYAELKSIGINRADTALTDVLGMAMEMFEAIFSSESKAERALVNARIDEAQKADPTSVAALKQFYATDNRADRLFDEVRALDRQWVDLYAFFSPLDVLDCLAVPLKSLMNQYTLSEKPVFKLKTFHSDCFETLGRLLVLAACYEGISTGAGMGVPTRNRLVPPQEFELIPNGSKRDVLSKMPFWTLFDGMFDHKLRNGIGHNSWRYSPSTDSIAYQNHSPSRGREEFSMSYIDFCIRTRKLYHGVTFAAKYLYSVWG